MIGLKIITQEREGIQRVDSRKKGGFGVVYQDVTRNKNISAAAKGLYAYLSAFCGVDDECYPSVETIVKEMGMGKDTFYRHINALVAAGVVEKRQTTNTYGQFGRTVYRLTHEVVISGFPIPQNEDTDKPETAHKETNNNNINNNSINNNNNNTICPEPDKPTPNPSGIEIPLNDKSKYDVPLEDIALWEETYPAVDVKGELKRMIAWLDSNPTKRKTRRGVKKFINGWLARTQDKGGSSTQKGEKQPVGNNTYNTDERCAEIERLFTEAGGSGVRWEDLHSE